MDFIQEYIDGKKLSGASLIVRKNDEIVFEKMWGFADIESGTPITEDSVFRVMSMTKCVTAAAVLRLADQGKLTVDDEVSKHLPFFADMQVIEDPRYPFPPKQGSLLPLLRLIDFNPDTIRTVPAEREVTIKDLLSHSCGIEQGIAGFIRMLKDKSIRENNLEQAKIYARRPLDFNPGTGTGYSPIAAFDILVSVIEAASGMPAAEYFKKEVFEPLGMKHSSFRPEGGDKENLVSLYKKTPFGLKNVTGTKKDTEGFAHIGKDYICGSGGLYSTLGDYDSFARMLCNEGMTDKGVFLKPETVKMMRTEAAENHLEPEPGYVWGLGVKIRQDKEKGKFACTEGTYGWSGAYGTHFFVSPEDRLSAVFMTNRSDIGGSGSFVNPVLEKFVFENFAKKEE